MDEECTNIEDSRIVGDMKDKSGIIGPSSLRQHAFRTEKQAPSSHEQNMETYIVLKQTIQSILSKMKI